MTDGTAEYKDLQFGPIKTGELNSPIYPSRLLTKLTFVSHAVDDKDLATENRATVLREIGTMKIKVWRAHQHAVTVPSTGSNQASSIEAKSVFEKALKGRQCHTS